MSRRFASAFVLLLSASLGATACGDSQKVDDFIPNNNPSLPVDSSTPSTTVDASTSTPAAVDSGSVVNPISDAGAFDASKPNTLDASAPDAADSLDASSADASSADASTADVVSAEASVSDAGLFDAATDAAIADAAPSDAGNPQASCLDGITNYQSAGPFKYLTKTSGKVNLWVPEVPAGCRVPVVHLANGTTATCSNYKPALERLASHGFLTVCYEDTNTGAGQFGITAFETALQMYPNLADNKLGSTGHSQGGQASIVTVQLAEAKWGNMMTIAGLAMQPASGYGTQPQGQTWKQAYAKVKAPIFMFSGDSGTGFANSSLLGFGTGDGLVAISWVQEGFDALSKSIEAYHWLAVGATHIPTPTEAEQQVSIPWFRWKLLGDKAACEFFKKMTQGGKWKVQKEQNAKACQ